MIAVGWLTVFKQALWSRAVQGRCLLGNILVFPQYGWTGQAWWVILAADVNSGVTCNMQSMTYTKPK